MLLSNHSHHDCPSCPYEFHQRACCSIVIAGAAITLVRNASAGHTTTLLSLLFTPFFSAPPLLSGCFRTIAIWGHRNALTSVRGFWKPCRGQFRCCCQKFSITARTHFLKTDLLPRISFSLHIFINMLLQLNRARPKTPTVLTSACQDEGTSAEITHHLLFF